MDQVPCHQSFRKNVRYRFLLQKLQQLWKLDEELKLMDLGKDYYLVKFKFDYNYSKVLHEGPWFVGQHFLTIRHWVPKFYPDTTESKETALWIRLLGLPLEFYDIT